ncbi:MULTISPECIES: TetR/AcrR family transcriptional regulator [unclassified Arthrobacter]|uniref:TetR/AcrR family transcriptional regulator n=1 Tax=unclassified Arthrobacter TaxID=235627 RepID=UPI002DF9A77B|nr:MULTISPECIES: TetR/AcrR family transcriptional regulator [unclassified Arthrobacter]MEC5190984.1 AcrR family transcriptional regulator [Arthrobacter sp. MP_M4]
MPQTEISGGAPAGSPVSSGGSVDGRASRWQSHREERRRELIKSARKAVHRLGSDASMEDIAAAAGTSKSVFYRYFGDKAGLQQAVGQVVLSQMQRRIQEAAQSAQTPREGLLAMVSAYLQMAETSPNVYSFVTRYTPGDAEAAGAGLTTAGPLGHFFAAISDMIARPMRNHLGDSAGREAVIGFWPNAAIGMVRNAGEQWLASPASPAKPGQEAMARQITDWLCLGIAPELRVAAPDPASPNSTGTIPTAPTLSEPTKEST